MPDLKYTKPYIFCAEALVEASSYKLTELDDTTPPRPFAVDRIVISDDTLQDNTTDPGASVPSLISLNMRWWLSKTGTGRQSLQPLHAYADHIPKSGYDAFAANGDIRTLSGPIPPVLVKKNESLIGSWENPSVANSAGLVGGVIHLMASGRGLTTGMRRVLYNPMTATTSTGSAAAGTSGNVGVVSTSKNDWDEDVLIDYVTIIILYDGTVPTDKRWFQHLRMRLAFTPGARWLSPEAGGSTGAVLPPLIAYGYDRSMPMRSVILQPKPSAAEFVIFPEGPPTFEFYNNNNTYKDRAIITFFGRLAE